MNLPSQYLKKPAFIVLLVGIFIVGVFLGYFSLKLSRIFLKNNKTNDIGEQVSPPPDFDPNAPFNVLLLGYGGAGHDGGTLSDTLIVARISPKEKQIALISVPRDLWVAIPYDWENTKNYKINMAYAIGLDNNRYANKKPEFRGEVGGGNMSKHVVGQITGLPIKYFVAVNFDGFKSVIDTLGGIDVAIPKTFDDSFYPVKGLENETCGLTSEKIAEFHAKYSGFDLEKQFTCRYEHLHFEQGISHLDGETALKFVRSRHSDTYGGDFSRSERQYALLTAIKDKIVSLEGAKKFNPLLDGLIESVRTDLDANGVKGIFDLIGNPKDYKFSQIHLTEDNVLIQSTSSDGQYILIPKEGINKWEQIKKYISEQLATVKE